MNARHCPENWVCEIPCYSPAYVVERETWCFSDKGIDFDDMHDECD